MHTNLYSAKNRENESEALVPHVHRHNAIEVDIHRRAESTVVLVYYGWRGGATEGRRACDQEIAGSIPGWASCSHPCASATKQ